MCISSPQRLEDTVVIWRDAIRNRGRCWGRPGTDRQCTSVHNSREPLMSS